MSLAPMRASAEGPSPAPTPAAREQARKLAQQGFDALTRKDYAAAEDLFRRADEFVHAPTLELDHARALVGLRKFVEGHEQYEQVIREGVAPNAPWQWKAAVVEAREELAAVNRAMAWLTITVRGGQAPAVQVDGKAVPGAALGVPRATNPGSRVVSVSAAGFLPVERAITLSEGQTAKLELKLEPDPHATTSVEHAAPRVVVIEAPPPPPPGPDRTLPIVLLSAGGAGIVVGAVTGVLALNLRSDLKGACNGRACVPTTESEYEDYRQKRDKYRGLGTASGVAFAMGAGAALGGAALWLFTAKPVSSSSERSARETRPTSASVQLGLGSLFVSGAF
ncbi:MAG: hypothetical protein ABI488_22040 [Polyangiaceae bacterium]